MLSHGTDPADDDDDEPLNPEDGEPKHGWTRIYIHNRFIYTKT